MRKIYLSLILFLAFSFDLKSQPNPQTITLSAQSVPTVQSISANIVGNRGNSTYYFSVVANFNRGQSRVTNQAIVRNAPDTLNGTNYVTVSWNPTTPPANSYDLLLTTTSNIPSPCTCAVATGLTSFTRNVQSNSLSSYTLAPVPNVVANISLDNLDNSYPSLRIDTSLGVPAIGLTTIAAGVNQYPLASSVKAGTITIVTDNTSGDCVTSLGSNAFALCMSNGTSWVAIGGGGGGGGITQLIGDATAGPGTGTQTITFATVNSNVGTFGDSTHVGQFTVNAKGLITAASNVAITGGSGGSPTFPVNPQTSTYQVLASDFSACKDITVASGTFTITLVASGSQPTTGQCIWITNYGGGIVTIAPSGQNINGASTNLTLPASSNTGPSEAFIVSDGSNYFAGLSNLAAIPNTSNLLIGGTGNVAANSGIAVGNLFLRQGSGSPASNISNAGVHNQFPSSASEPGFVLPGLAPPSNANSNPGTFGTDSVANNPYVCDGGNCNWIPQIAGSGTNPPSNPTTNAMVKAVGGGFKYINSSLIDNGIIMASTEPLALGATPPATTGSGIIGLGETTGQTCPSAADCIIANSTNHELELINNAGSQLRIPQVIASGTAAMGTGAISSGTCATVVTISATGTLTTDRIQYVANTDPTVVTGYAVASGGSLYIQAYPTANNVNFKVCNPTSGSLTPAALTLNWGVVR